MSDPNLGQRSLISAGIGLAAVVSTEPILTLLLLAGGAIYAVRAIIVGRGWGRPLPAAVLVAIVVAAHYAPVKMIEMAKDGRMTVPKAVMTVAELRDPDDHGLERPSLPRSYHIPRSLPAGVEESRIRFPAENLTVGEFIRAIESQTPLRHHFLSCGNAGSSILGGRNWDLGLFFDVPE